MTFCHLFPPPKCWDPRHVLLYPMHVVLGTGLWASYIQGKRSAGHLYLVDCVLFEDRFSLCVIWPFLFFQTVNSVLFPLNYTLLMFHVILLLLPHSHRQLKCHPQRVFSDDSI